MRGIVHRPDAQLVLRRHPRPAPAAHAARRAAQRPWCGRPGPRSTSSAFCLPADEKIGPGDRFIVTRARRGAAAPPRSPSSPRPTWSTPRPDRPSTLLDVRDARRRRRASTGPRSCRSRRWPATRSSCSPTCWSALLPEAPPLYPDGELTDEPEADPRRRADPRGGAGGRARRAAALDRRRRRGDGAPRGPAGRPAAARHPRLPLRRAATARRASSSATRAPGCATSAPRARQQIEALLGTPVYLDLHVKVAKDWQRDPRQLRKLGF